MAGQARSDDHAEENTMGPAAREMLTAVSTSVGRGPAARAVPAEFLADSALRVPPSRNLL